MNALKLEDHPLASSFPLLSGAELNDLAINIKEDGQQVPIILFEGKILDGRNRYRACLKANVNPITDSWTAFAPTLPNPDIDPLDWVISTNLHRRHLNETQREAIAAELVLLQEARIREKQMSSELELKPDDAPADPTKGEQVDAVAKQLNVKPRNVRKAINIKKDAVAELQEAHKAGQIKTSTAEKLSKLSSGRQKAVAKASKSASGAVSRRIQSIAAKVGQKPRGGLAAAKQAALERMSPKQLIALAIENVENLYTDTVKAEKGGKEPDWKTYHKRVISRLKGLV